jgi:GNAT superfamily N-acetyltransferase
LTDDKTRLDLAVIASLLARSYWAADRSHEFIERSIQNSLCFALFHQARQIGFARAITDRTTFSWICDVIIDPDHRRRGLGKWMVQSLLEHPDLRDTTQVLRTRDAHGFYERFGFERTEYLRRRRSVPPS